MIKPLNNHCLIELIDENEGVIGSSDENFQKGILVDYRLLGEHLTASTGHTITGSILNAVGDILSHSKGKVVYWQEYADSGSKFKQDGKDYVLIPFYRIIGYEK